MISKQFYRSLSPTLLLFAEYINLVSDIFCNNKFPYDGILNEANSASTSAATLDGAIFFQSEFKCFTVLLHHFDGDWVFQSESIVIHPFVHYTGTCRTLCVLSESMEPIAGGTERSSHIIETSNWISLAKRTRSENDPRVNYFIFMDSFSSFCVQSIWLTMDDLMQ